MARGQRSSDAPKAVGTAVAGSSDAPKAVGTTAPARFLVPSGHEGNARRRALPPRRLHGGRTAAQNRSSRRGRAGVSARKPVRHAPRGRVRRSLGDRPHRSQDRDHGPVQSHPQRQRALRPHGRLGRPGRVARRPRSGFLRRVSQSPFDAVLFAPLALLDPLPGFAVFSVLSALPGAGAVALMLRDALVLGDALFARRRALTRGRAAAS